MQKFKILVHNIPPETFYILKTCVTDNIGCEQQILVVTSILQIYASIYTIIRLTIRKLAAVKSALGQTKNTKPV